MVKRIKTVEKKLRHNCPSCQSTYTLLETHLTRKDNQTCPINCKEVWEKIITKYCQEKVLGQELSSSEEEKVLGQELEQEKDHESN